MWRDKRIRESERLKNMSREAQREEFLKTVWSVMLLSRAVIFKYWERQ